MTCAASCQEVIESPHLIDTTQNTQRDFKRFFGERNAVFTVLVLKLACHPTHANALSDRIWEMSSDAEMNGDEMRAFLHQVHQKVAALYLKNRETLNLEKLDVLGNPLLDPNENIPTALNIPGEFPEVHAFGLNELNTKLDNARVVLMDHDPDSTPIFFEHAKPNGVIRESLVTEESYAAMAAQAPHTPFIFNGRREERGDIVSARPYTVTHRMGLFLLGMLGPDLHRLTMMGLNFNHSFRAETRRLLNRAANLIMAGAPNAWVVNQFAHRYLAAYRKERRKILEEISKKCPSIYRDILFKLPEHDLLREQLAERVLLDNGMDKDNPAYREITSMLSEVFKSYAKYSVSKTEQSAELAMEVTEGIARALVIHHPLFGRMLGLPEDLQIFLNTFSLVVNPESMPELFNHNPYFEKFRTQVTSPAPVSVQSEIGKLYLRAVLFIQTAAQSGNSTVIRTFMFDTLPAIAREHDGVYTVMATLQFYFIHREKILEELHSLGQ